VYAALGTAHGLFTLRDLRHPQTFTPTDDTVRLAMESTGVVMSAKRPWAQTLWRTWLGINLTHALGLLVFAGLLLTMAFADGSAFADSSLTVLAVIVAAVYVLIARAFLFIAPAVAASVALACIAAAWAAS
jgi:hypothetical protein